MNGPQSIAFANGVLNLATLELVPADHARRLTLPYDWQPDATCPAFDRGIDTIADAAAVLPWLGRLMTGSGPRVTFIVGCPESGRTTLGELAVLMVGRDNAAHLRPEQLIEKSQARLSVVSANIIGDMTDPELPGVRLSNAVRMNPRVHWIAASRFEPRTLRNWPVYPIDCATVLTRTRVERAQWDWAGGLAGEAPGIAVRAVAALHAELIA